MRTSGGTWKPGCASRPATSPLSALPRVTETTRERISREFDNLGPDACVMDIAAAMRGHNPELLDMAQRCAADLLDALADGRLQPVVQRSFRLDDIAAAHEYMERDEHVGKIVIEIG